MISRTIVSNMIPLIGAFFIVQTICANAGQKSERIGDISSLMQQGCRIVSGDAGGVRSRPAKMVTMGRGEPSNARTDFVEGQIVLANDKDLAVCVFQVIVDTPEGSADDTPFSMCWKIK